jgi:hypothetical protein
MNNIAQKMRLARYLLKFYQYNHDEIRQAIKGVIKAVNRCLFIPHQFIPTLSIFLLSYR